MKCVLLKHTQQSVLCKHSSVEETTPTESERPLEGAAAAAAVRARVRAPQFAFMVI